MIEDILWGLWNGLTAWPLLLLHVFSIWDQYPVYNIARDGGWYQFGFLLGAGSPFMGMFGRNAAAAPNKKGNNRHESVR
jgi:hypothetical protein